MASGFRYGEVKITTSMMIWMVLAITSVGALVISIFHVSNFVYYIADALNIILAYFVIKKVRKLKKIKELNFLIVLLVLFIISCMIGVIGNGVPLKLAIWGSRNVYRFILFFIACVVLLNKDDIKKFQSMFPKIYIINAILVIIQYFILGYKGDYIGGLFGTEQGCNGALTIFLNIALSFFIAEYLSGGKKLYNLIINAIIYFLVAALSETKGSYIFFVIIVITAVLVTIRSLKTFGIIFVTVFSLIVGGYLLNKYFPDSLDFLIDWNSANKYMSATYFGTITFTRNAALSVANKVFFKNNIWLYLFGYGIGACDTSSFFSSPFYDMFGYMNYRQISASMTVLQNGYVGLIICFIFYIYLFIIGCCKNKCISDQKEKQIMIMTCCLAVFAVGDNFYASLYIDAAYWLFFVISFPLVLIKDHGKRNRKKYIGGER